MRTCSSGKERLRLLWLCFWGVVGSLLVAPTSANYQTPQSSATALQPVIDAAPPGSLVSLNRGEVYTGAVIDKPGLTLDLNGAIIVPSPGITITAADVTLDCTNGGELNGDPTLSGQPSLLAGVTITEGGDNVIMMGCDVHQWADGVIVQGSVTSLKLVHNYLHENGDAGLQIDAGIFLTGIVSITGNLFKANAGPGIRYDGVAVLPASANSWGNMEGADAGDGLGGSGVVDAGTATFAEPFVGVDPDDFSIHQRTVLPASSFEVVVAVDAANLYGISFLLTYDPAILQLQTSASGEFAGQGHCFIITAEVGSISGVCYRQNPDIPATGVGVVVAHLQFLALQTGTSIFDLRTAPGELVTGARGGVGVYLNNGGYGDVAGNILRHITDENDGEIIVARPTSVNLTEFAGQRPDTATVFLLLAAGLLTLLAWRTRGWSHGRHPPLSSDLGEREQTTVCAGCAGSGQENSMDLDERNEEKLSCTSITGNDIHGS